MHAIWPGIFVIDESIAQWVMNVRRVLGDDKQVLLRILPRRGCLFALPVFRVDGAGVATPPSAPDLSAVRVPADPPNRFLLTCLTRSAPVQGG